MPQSDIPFLRTFYVLSGLTIIGPLAFETFLPALEDAAKDLNTEVSTLLITIAMMQVGTASGQIIYGPLSDRFGRRPVILGGMFVFILSSFLSSLITSPEPLYILRLIQGLAVASTMIIFRSAIRDLFSVNQGARMYSYLYIVLATMPLVGPISGGFLTEIFGWRSVFILMGCIGSLVFLVCLIFFRETLPAKDYQAISPDIVIASFTEMLRDRTFLSFLFCGMGAYGGLFAVLAGLAPVMMGFMGETPSIFGIQFAIVMAAHLVAALFAGQLIRTMGIKNLLYLATGIISIGGLLLLVLALADITTRASILGPISIFLIGFALTVGPMTAGAMSNFQHMAGRAASLLGFFQQGTGALVTLWLGSFDSGTQMPMVLILAGCSFFSFASFHLLVRQAPLKDE